VPLLKKVHDFLLGGNEFDVFGGSKGGYSYLIIKDKARGEIIAQYVSPPSSTTRKVGVNAQAYGVDIGVDYESGVDYSQTFAIENKSKTSMTSLNDTIPPINQYIRNTKNADMKTIQVQELDASQAIIAGRYTLPVAPDNIENASFQAHFGDLNKNVESGLSMVLEFILKTYWQGRSNYRASIFLHDAINKRLNMKVAYNMTGHIDYMLSLNDGAGNVGHAYTNKSIMVGDFDVLRHEERGVDSSRVWKDLKSILAVPIIDNDEIPLGALAIDSSDNYVAARFKDESINQSLQTLCRGIGRLLEAYA
jgi:hypothetical protein